MNLFVVLVPALAAFIATSWLQPYILRFAKEKHIVDNPDARKLQRVPIPIMGGVAVVFGLLIGVMCCNILGDFNDMFAVFVSAFVLMFVGMIDDIKGLSPQIRFFVEVLVVALLIFVTGTQIDNFKGLWGINTLNAWWTVPLTIFACVGIINAINLIDGVDGYSSGYCIMASLMFGIAFYIWGNLKMVVLAAIIVSALLPFFVCNVFGKESKMFIGDAGTLSMGVLMATFVTSILSKTTDISNVDPNVGLIPFTLAVMSVPVFDTLRVMSVRILKGRSPFSPDKTHLHHLFIEYGFSHIGTTFSILSMNAIVVLCWLIVCELGMTIEGQLYVVIGMSVLITFVFYAVMTNQLAKNTKICRFMKRLGRYSHIERQGFWLRLQNWLDRKVGPEEEAERQKAA